jgi:hypothetical protein
MQKWAGSEVARPIDVTKEHLVYLSTAGRAFQRSTLTVHRAGSASRERPPTSKETAVKFEGRSLVLDNLQFRSNTVQRIVVYFDSAFSSCSAKVILGSEKGKPLRQWGPVSGREVQVESISIANTRCSIRDGNAFGGG